MRRSLLIIPALLTLTGCTIQLAPDNAHNSAPATETCDKTTAEDLMIQIMNATEGTCGIGNIEDECIIKVVPSTTDPNTIVLGVFSRVAYVSDAGRAAGKEEGDINASITFKWDYESGVFTRR